MSFVRCWNGFKDDCKCYDVEILEDNEKYMRVKCNKCGEVSTWWK